MLQPNLFGGNGARFSEGVQLFVFSPRSHGVTMLRPQTFNFNLATATELMGNSRSVENVALRYSDPNSGLNQTILPSAEGIKLDTYNHDQYWSFILVIDASAMPSTDVRYGGPRNRTVLTGYFLDEPFAPHTLEWVTPVQNNLARIQFTQESRVTMQRISAASSADYFVTSANNDLIPQSLSVMANTANGDLMLVDSGTIADNTAFEDDGDTRYVSNNDAVVGQFTKARSNPREIYSPKNQILGIAKGIEHGMIEAESEVEKYSAYGAEGYAEHVPSVFMSNASSQIRMSNGSRSTIGTGLVDPSLPTVFGDLDQIWPQMRVMPIKIPSMSDYDVYGQEHISIRSTMSNLAVSTISSMAIEHKLASIGFRYSSWSPNQIAGNIGGSWHIEFATPLIQGTDVDFENSMRRFKKHLEDCLWPTIKSIGGEFDIMVNFDMTNSTLVDLNYYDIKDGAAGSYYEHHNRLGGFAAPNVGDQNTYQHNLNQYTSVLGAVGAKIDGPRTFGKGPSDSNTIIPQATREEILNQQYTF